jgi:fructose-1,6-bisphosphatase/sedoheptulose 1,7-bisphosphatase-like protein
VKVNFRDKKYATLHNFSNITFYVELHLRTAKNNSEEEEETDENKDGIDKNFSLDFKSGIIAANSKVDIGIIFNPTQVTDYDLIMDVIASEKNEKAEQTMNRATSATKKLVS